MPEVVVNTSNGPVRGLSVNGVHRFFGVPYAPSPTGSLRFAAPAAAVPWQDCRDATTRGPTAPQPNRDFAPLDLTPIDGGGWRKGDQFLTLDAWTESIAGKRPVMVFIHGGSFVGGCSDASAYDGTAFAQSGVAFFSVNYRLGIEGFLPVPGGVSNLGLRDQIAALTWIKENAAAFGGDPSNMTVFGQSAGGMALATLMSSPLATGLFHRAIIQSGSGSMVRTLASAQPLISQIAKMLGITPTVEGFRSRSIAESIEAVKSLLQGGVLLPEEDGRDPGFGLSPFLPVYGDDVLPLPPLTSLKTGTSASIDLLIGTTLEETNLFFVPGLLDAAAVEQLLIAADPAANKILAHYALQMQKAVPSVVLTQVMTDLVFRSPARTFAAAHQGKTHFYEFGWRSPACGGALGACHGLDLPFVFDTLESAMGPRGLLGSQRPQELAAQIHKIWVDFASHGSVPWPEFNERSREVFRLDTGSVSEDTITIAEKYER